MESTENEGPPGVGLMHSRFQSERYMGQINWFSVMNVCLILKADVQIIRYIRYD